MLTATFRLARETGACTSSYRQFAKHVGGIEKYGQNTPIPLTEIADKRLQNIVTRGYKIMAENWEQRVLVPEWARMFGEYDGLGGFEFRQEVPRA